ncbi:MAG: aminomethyl-transferring glycine dehydrogenase subunit GcvPA [Thermoplasmata archaeon]|nr:aminomethyl-transferring glycine dehydrogenase subunit GcvPA [Thermoplasmata archaeon]
MHYIPNDSLEEDILKRMGLSSIDDLFSDIPESLRLKRLNIPEGISELEVMREFNEMMNGSTCSSSILSFLGGGCYDHYIPALSGHILSRSELYTSYTPYQPELSQGMLQSLFEYQSLMGDLLKMDAVNSSMYDWATAISESVLMSARVSRKKIFLLPEIISRDKIGVVENYVRGANIDIKRIPFNRETGTTDETELERMITPDIAGVYLENPNMMGLFEPVITRVKSLLGPRQMLVVGINPLSLGMVSPPGSYGADIVVGDAQPVGLHMNYGGPTAGIFASTMDIVRKMPGRIIGLTKDAEGNMAFCMTLSTREQHIRRERATSNICTNEALSAISVAIHLATLGKNGLRELSIQVASRARNLAERIDLLEGFDAPAYGGHFFNEFPVRCDVDVQSLLDEGKKRGVLIGINMCPEIECTDKIFTISTTEMHTMEDYDQLLKILKESREVLQ